MDFDAKVRLGVYSHFAETGRAPSVDDVASRVGASGAEVVAAYQRLDAAHALVLDEDRESIRMAMPFSGVETPHTVESEGVHYFANCAWDVLGVAAALQRRSLVRSRCEQSREPLTLDVGLDGPPPSDWLFHSLIPAARWWENVVFT